MKAVILAGGIGTRISEESQLRPKPMIEIGGRPILWHILKIYAHYGITDFVICCGYKGYFIKEYFANYFLHNSDVTFDLKNNNLTIHQTSSDPWRVSVIDTGEMTQTGGRLKRAAAYLDSDEDFCFTYGDGVGNVNISKLVEFHKNHRKLSSVTAVKPPGRFGALEMTGTQVRNFKEKPQGDGSYINGGFFVLNPGVMEFIKDDGTLWEKEPMEELAAQGQMVAYVHNGFWQPMDTLRDKVYLEDLWNSNKAPWKVWS